MRVEFLDGPFMQRDTHPCCMTLQRDCQKTVTTFVHSEREEKKKKRQAPLSVDERNGHIITGFSVNWHFPIPAGS